MASKNSVKLYIPNSFYHIYNRGVEKRNIFLDEQDYSVFLSYLKTYLLPKNEEDLRNILVSQQSSAKEKDKALKLLKLKNYSQTIDLICYALLPNHFHLLVKQKTNVLDKFMNSLGTRYAMYFNRKYKRKGVLFQDVYKAVLVNTDDQLVHLSRYIHLNPTQALGFPPTRWEETTFPSSLFEFLGKRTTSWIIKSHILDYFSRSNKKNTYEEFLGLPLETELIEEITIDLDQD